MERKAAQEEGYVQLTAGKVFLHGNLLIPEQAKGLVAFAHGSGSSRHSPRNQYVAQILRNAGLATLLFDLLISFHPVGRALGYSTAGGRSFASVCRD